MKYDLSKLKTNDSIGRIYQEFNGNLESNFSIDKYRVISSNAFKRLEGKTQVFPSDRSNHVRKRLIHSIEVEYIASLITKILNLNQDLTSTIALSHDFGHPPFGHYGEEVLNEILQKYGLYFSHNEHTVKLLTKIEKFSLNYSGLNLSYEIIDGLIKHNGPIITNYKNKYILEFIENSTFNGNKINLLNYPSLEAQIANIADDIAYICHDFEDSIYQKTIPLEKYLELDLIKYFPEKIDNCQNKLHQNIAQIKNYIKNIMVEDVLQNTIINIEKYKITSIEDVYSANCEIVNFSEEMFIKISQIKQFMYNDLYHNKKITKNHKKYYKTIHKAFKMLMNNGDKLLKRDWKESFIKAQSDQQKTTIVCDFIAGMTDNYIQEFIKL